MKDILHDIDAWTARGDKVAIAMVVSVKRSAPRPPGAKMAISSSGEASGAVSGGWVGGGAIQAPEEGWAGGPPRPLNFGTPDEEGGAVGRPGGPRQLLNLGTADEEGWDVGLPCGGESGVWVERYEP